MKKKNAMFLITGGLIAALYAMLTYLSAAFGLAYGPIQFRISEAFTVLPIFSPAAIPGLAIGCLISNIGSFNAADMLFGTIATLLAAIFTRLFRNIKIKGIPFLSLLCPVVFNAVIIGLELALLYFDEFSFMGFIIAALEVGLGELLVCFILGIPFIKLLEKHNDKLFGKLNK